MVVITFMGDTTATDRSIRQPVNQPTCQSINQSINPPITQSQPINQPINQSTNQSTSQSTHQSLNQRTNLSICLATINQSIFQSLSKSWNNGLKRSTVLFNPSSVSFMCRNLLDNHSYPYTFQDSPRSLYRAGRLVPTCKRHSFLHSMLLQHRTKLRGWPAA